MIGTGFPEETLHVSSTSLPTGLVITWCVKVPSSNSGATVCRGKQNETKYLLNWFKSEREQEKNDRSQRINNHG